MKISKIAIAMATLGLISPSLISAPSMAAGKSATSAFCSLLSSIPELPGARNVTPATTAISILADATIASHLSNAARRAPTHTIGEGLVSIAHAVFQQRAALLTINSALVRANHGLLSNANLAAVEKVTSATFISTDNKINNGLFAITNAIELTCGINLIIKLHGLLKTKHSAHWSGLAAVQYVTKSPVTLIADGFVNGKCVPEGPGNPIKLCSCPKLPYITMYFTYSNGYTQDVTYKTPNIYLQIVDFASPSHPVTTELKVLWGFPSKATINTANSATGCQEAPPGSY